MFNLRAPMLPLSLVTYLVTEKNIMKTRTRVQAAMIGLGATLPTLLSNQAATAATTPTAPVPATSKVIAPTKFPTADTPYCATIALTAKQLRAHQFSDINCYATVADSEAAGYVASNPSYDGPATNAIELNAMAIHYDSTGGTGLPELKVMGTGPTCDGGGINLDPSSYYGWANDMISSTRHGSCGKIKHYDDVSLQGPMCTTTGPRDYVDNYAACLAAEPYHYMLNNRVSAIRYFAS